VQYIFIKSESKAYCVQKVNILFWQELIFLRETKKGCFGGGWEKEA